MPAMSALIPVNALSGVVGPTAEPPKHPQGRTHTHKGHRWNVPSRAFHAPADTLSSTACIFEMEDLDDEVSVSTRTSSTGFSQETSILQRLAQQHRPIEAELTRAATSAVALTNVLPPRADPPPVTHAVASILAALQSSSSLVTVLLRTGRTSPSLASCLSTLRHTVVIVRGLKTEDLILDPCFRSQFVIPHAPPAYHEFLNTHVPAVLVGDAAHVHAVVSAVSSAIATVYKCTLDNTVPPWRKHSALLSKFVPSAFDDVVVDGAQSVASVLVGIDHVDAHETRTIAGALVDGMAKVLRDKRRLVDGGVSPRTVFLQEAVAAV